MHPRTIALAGPVVLVDMDGVTVDFFAGLQTKMAELIGASFKPLPLIACTKHIVQDVFDGGLSDIAHQLARESGFFRDLPPFPGAIEAITQMAELYQVYLCTAPYHDNPTCASDKFTWVRRHLGRDWCDRVVLAGGDKTLVRGDLLIDDKPVVVGNHQPTWKHLHFDNGCAYCRPSCGVVSINWSNWRQVIERQLQQTEYQQFVARGMNEARQWRCPSSLDD
ncbi:MAG: hypothetical protein Q7S64_00280 [bacterium]|nr:hypothetical protein [bacterium]